MTALREAAEAALKELESLLTCEMKRMPMFVDQSVVSTLRAALSAPQVEQPGPVWIQPDHLAKARVAPFLCRVEPAKRDDFVPLYTTPPQRTPLTTFEINDVMEKHGFGHIPLDTVDLEDVVRAVERAVWLKNGIGGG